MKNILLPVKEADIDFQCALASRLRNAGHNVIFWSYMPHESALLQDEYLRLKEFSQKNKYELLTTTQDEVLNVNKYSEELYSYYMKNHEKDLNKAFFAIQYFTSEYFDRNYAPKLALNDRKNIFSNYMTLSQKILNQYEINTIIVLEENTEFARSVLGLLASTKPDLKYLTIRFLENGRLIAIDDMLDQQLVRRRKPLEFKLPSRNSFIRKSSLSIRLKMHVREIVNILRYSLNKFKVGNKIVLKGRFIPRVLKTLTYIVRDMVRFIRKSHKTANYNYDIVVSVQTYPESSTVIDTFPRISLLGQLEELSARYLGTKQIAVILHPNTDFEIPLRIEKAINRLPNMQVYNSWSGKSTLDYMSKSSVLISTTSNTALKAILEGHEVIIDDDGWLSIIMKKLEQQCLNNPNKKMDLPSMLKTELEYSTFMNIDEFIEQEYS